MANEILVSTIEQQVKTYLAYFAAHPNGEEIQYRTSFETLFNGLLLPFTNKTSIVQEDRRSGIDVDGTPDFFVYKNYGTTAEARHATPLQSLVGFIECKKPSYNLEKLIGSEQIKKYSKTCENIIITNYLRFILLQGGKKIHDITLADDTNNANNANKGINPLVIQKFENLLRDFYLYD
ncbi:MAG: hypothetical protein LBS94_02935, partial [Prevotellaceae bacterium]|nr:hypothetical protein [Prevotellaceae bacterium]